MILINFEPSVVVGHHGMHTVTHLITGIHLMVCPREPLERPLGGRPTIARLEFVGLEADPVVEHGSSDVPVAALLLALLDAPETGGQTFEVISGDTPIAEAVTTSTGE